jgi:hypothetical protein
MKQARQLGDIRRDALGFVVHERLRRAIFWAAVMNAVCH